VGGFEGCRPTLNLDPHQQPSPTPPPHPTPSKPTKRPPATPQPHRSPSSRTALAEAELEYPEGHRSRSIYVALPIAAAGPGVPPEVAAALEGAALAIWTTTPWTIPANLAVAVNEKLDYALVEAKVGFGGLGLGLGLGLRGEWTLGRKWGVILG